MLATSIEALGTYAKLPEPSQLTWSAMEKEPRQGTIYAGTKTVHITVSATANNNNGEGSSTLKTMSTPTLSVNYKGANLPLSILCEVNDPDHSDILPFFTSIARPSFSQQEKVLLLLRSTLSLKSIHVHLGTFPKSLMSLSNT